AKHLTAAAARAAEDISEHIAENVAESVGSAAAAARGEALMAILIIDCPLLRIREDFVGFLGLLEFILSLVVVRVAVGMALHRQTAIGLLDLGFTGRASQFEHLVIVALGHCYPCIERLPLTSAAPSANLHRPMAQQSNLCLGGAGILTTPRRITGAPADARQDGRRAPVLRIVQASFFLSLTSSNSASSTSSLAAPPPALSPAPLSPAPS